MKSILSVLLLLCCSVAFSETPKKTGIYFRCSCDDTAGILFASAFRDALAASPRYELATSAEGKDAKGADYFNWNVAAVSIDPIIGNPGDTTVLSLVLLYGKNVYITNFVQSCNASTVKACAAGTLSHIDSILNNSN